jgi:hypothetical protein
MSDKKNDTALIEEKRLETLTDEERAKLNEQMKTIVYAPFSDEITELLTHLHEKLADEKFLRELTDRIVRDHGDDS